MIITKKALSRRMLLRGAGTALALPLLDAMIPALTGDHPPLSRNRLWALRVATCS